MGGEWRRTTVGQVSKRVTKGTTPTTIGGRFTETGVSFVKVEAISDDGRFLRHRFAFIDNETDRMLSRSRLQDGDVLFTIAGTIGRVGRVTREILPANTNQAVAIVRPDSAVVDGAYLYYVLRDEARVENARTRIVQSVQANFSLAELSAIELPLPPIGHQHAIAHILSALDDKIDLNRRMSETLEAMARALFKSWFVDFDPVRAKAEGREPSLPRAVADLFPSSFEDSELGDIPEGWRVARLDDVVLVVDCLHSKKPDQRDEGMTLLGLQNIRDDGLLDLSVRYAISEADFREWTSRFEPLGGDCVITNVGRVGAVAQIPEGAQVALGRNMTGLRCRETFPFPTVLIQCLCSDALREEIERKTDAGTILNALNVRNIPHLRFVCSTNEILSAFERACRPLRARMERNLEESRTLAVLRDSLLPRLISGELRIPDAERIVGEVA